MEGHCHPRVRVRVEVRVRVRVLTLIGLRAPQNPSGQGHAERASRADSRARLIDILDALDGEALAADHDSLQLIREDRHREPRRGARTHGRLREAQHILCDAQASTVEQWEPCLADGRVKNEVRDDGGLFEIKI